MRTSTRSRHRAWLTSAPARTSVPERAGAQVLQHSPGADPQPDQSLIGAWMPAWDVATRHEIRIKAGPEAVWYALFHTDLGSLPVVRVLVTLRSIPALLADPRASCDRLRGLRSSSASLRTLRRDDFAVLEEREPREIVLGITGKFWDPHGGLLRTERDTFRAALPPGMAQGTWGFRLEEVPGGTRLVTETRVRCADAAARWSFRWYWMLIRPFSGWIRISMLRAIRRAAERAQ